jgi:hypothetical protein
MSQEYQMSGIPGIPMSQEYSGVSYRGQAFLHFTLNQHTGKEKRKEASSFIAENMHP